MLKESCTGASANEASCKAYKTEATAAASSINILNYSGIDAIAAADEKRQTNQLVNNTLTPTPPLQGSYGAGFYTPLGGGEIEVDIERGQLTGVKLGLGVGAGAHITSGGVSGGITQGATHGGKSPANESNPIQPGEARVGSSLSIGAGVGIVGIEGGIAGGVGGTDTDTAGYINYGTQFTTIPRRPIIGAEIKFNIIEFQVRPPPQNNNPKGAQIKSNGNK